MKKILFVFATLPLLFSACSEKQDPPSDTGSVRVCKTLHMTNYDGSGNINTQTFYYYSGDRLDSMVTRDKNGGRSAYLFEYKSDLERERHFMDIHGQKVQGYYSVEKLDEYGNVLEEKSYDQDGVFTGRYVYQFGCN